MELSIYKNKLIELSKLIGVDINSVKGIDCFQPIFELIKKDKSIIIIKLDGEREENIYTLIASGKKLGNDESIRMDTSDVEAGLSYICVEYARKAWGIEV
jgi:hypothetical protein